MTRPARKAEIAALLEQGREAYLAGRSNHCPPLMPMTAYMHWCDGWEAAKREHEAADAALRAESCEDAGRHARLQVITAFQEFMDTKDEASMKRLDEKLREWEQHIIGAKNGD